MKVIPNFPDYYADTKGNIWSYKRKKYYRLNPGDNGKGYLYCFLYKNGKQFRFYVHHLILKTFIGNCPIGMQACHQNSVRNDNKLSNLRWDTASNNEKDKLQNDTYFPSLKTMKKMQEKAKFRKRNKDGTFK